MKTWLLAFFAFGPMFITSLFSVGWKATLIGLVITAIILIPFLLWKPKPWE